MEILENQTAWLSIFRSDYQLEFRIDASGESTQGHRGRFEMGLYLG